MRTIFFQLMNMILVLFLLGVPVVITFLLLKHFKKSKDHKDYMEQNEYLLEKIRELESRIQELENKAKLASGGVFTSPDA